MKVLLIEDKQKKITQIESFISNATGETQCEIVQARCLKDATRHILTTRGFQSLVRHIEFERPVSEAHGRLKHNVRSLCQRHIPV